MAQAKKKRKKAVKLIFLDIDGVLNWVGTKDRMNGMVGLDPERIIRFNQIIEAVPDAKIVVSSTWRYIRSTGFYEDFAGLKKLLADRGLKGKIIGKTLKRFGHLPRGGEIREFIEDFERDFPGQKIKSFVVLDDDTSGMEGYSRKPTRFVGKLAYLNDVLEDEEETPDAIDLRPYQVITTWGGKDGPGYGEPAIEGGLTEDDVSLAIKILKGYKKPVRMPPAGGDL